MMVLDTQAWLWWMHDPSRLPARARRAIQAAEKGKGLRVSAISVWPIFDSGLIAILLKPGT